MDRLPESVICVVMLSHFLLAVCVMKKKTNKGIAVFHKLDMACIMQDSIIKCCV